MPVPTLISELSQTAGSNSPSGSESPITTDNYLRAHAGFIAELRDKVLEIPTVADYATLAAAVASGEPVIFPPGNTAVADNITITQNVYFSPGAYITIASTKVVTLDGFIESSRQHIFRGSGTVLLNGEKSHNVFPEWWGAFPDTSGTDADVPLQALSDAVVTAREVNILFPGGTYYLAAAVDWSRACRILGSGKRQTHFRCKTAFSSGDVFTTAEQGVEFYGIQFSSVTTPRTSGAYINMSYNYCVAKDIWFTDGFGGINIAANVCTVDGVTGFTWSSNASSYVVQLAGGFNSARVQNVTYIDTGSNTPPYMVKVLDHTLFQIENLQGRGCGTVLGFVPSSGTCGRGQVAFVQGQATITNAVLIAPSGTADVEHISFAGINADAPTGSALKIDKSTSGVVKYLIFQDIQSRAAVGTAVKVSASSGRVDHFSILGGSITNGAGDGIDIANAYYWSVNNVQTVTNGGTGTKIGNTCVGFDYSHNRNYFNTTSNLTDSSGAVTKVVEDNMAA